MVPVLKLFAVVFLVLFVFPQPVLTSAQSRKIRIVNASESISSPDSTLDDETRTLLAAGKDGFLIESVREEVLSLLSESNSCTSWFISADTAARAKFHSLHFELDTAGAAEILRIDGPSSGYYHPYVASTRQDVGPGSTITLNANGAFFRTSAFVRDPHHPSDRISASAYRLLSVGNYSGASPEAQLLTLLHEFGHIVDLLPIDAGMPTAPFISIQNTETVLHYCRSQIQAHAKHLRLAENSARTLPLSFAKVALEPTPTLQAFAQKRSFRELGYRNDGW
jgi:hypothetical protein